MEFGCAGESCGNCCDPIMMPKSRQDIEAALKSGQIKSRRAKRDLMFMLRNWTWTGEYSHKWIAGQETFSHHVQCAKFDRETRLCGAHEQRPFTCRGFPFYDHDPMDVVPGMTDTHSQCSYMLNVPRESRPPGARPLIPIEVVQHAHVDDCSNAVADPAAYADLAAHPDIAERGGAQV